jgi:hypothetical protein
MIVFDVPSNGLCGYYALQVLNQVWTFPREVCEVSMDDVRAGMARMSALILRQANEFEQTRSSGGSVDEDSAIAILRTALLVERQYHKYVKAPDKFDWLLFCKDLENGEIWFDYSFFPFAREAWMLSEIEIECIDAENSQIAGKIPPGGALIGVGSNHFVVALPRVIGNGIEIKEIICEDRDGRRWRSAVGEPASMIPFVQPPVSDQGSHSGAADMALSCGALRGPADPLPLPQFTVTGFVDESLAEIQRSLHKDMVLFDFPELIDGYYALLAIRSVLQCPKESTIMISKKDVDTCLSKIITSSPWEVPEDKPEEYFEDLRTWKVPFDASLLVRVIMALDLPSDIVIVSSDNLVELGKFYSHGVLIQCEYGSFMAALPAITSDGVEIKEIIYEDWYGRRWRSAVGEPASMIPFVRPPVSDQGSHSGAADMALRLRDALRGPADPFPLPQFTVAGFVDESLAEIAEITKIQRSLHKDMVLSDLPGLGNSYYALLVLSSVCRYPDQSTIKISRSEIDGFLRRLTIVIDKTCSNIPKIQRDKFCNDLRSWDLPIGTALLPLALNILRLPREIAIVSSSDIARLGEFYPCGVLIQCQNNHLVVALQKRRGDELGLTKIICEDQDGYLYRFIPRGPTSRDQVTSYWRTSDAEQDDIAADVYFDFILDYGAYGEECEKMQKVQEKLPSGMVLLDVPGFRRSGYFALLAIQFAMNHPDALEIRISKEQLSSYCRAIAGQIGQDFNKQSQGLEVSEEFEILQAVLQGEERCCDDQGEVVWKEYLDDMRNGRVEMNDAVLPFACKVLGLNFDTVLRGDGKISLGNIPPNGTPIYWPSLSHYGFPIHSMESNHFMVILPKNGRKWIKLVCQEQDGRWWYSLSGLLVRCE